MNITGFTAGKNGSVIVNVDMTGVNKVTLPERSFVFIDNTKQDTDEKTSFVAGRVIWNFINAEGKTITTGQMTGTILAPGADIVIPTNLNGTVIADKINNTGETHRDDFVGKTDTPPDDDDVPPTDDTPEPPTPPVQKPEPANASATFEGIKHVVGDENATIADYEGAFEFDLYDELGEEIQKAYNGANGSFSFETIVYDKAGTFRYTIREKHFGETIDEITYDDAEYIVQVKVSLDEDTNSLVAEVTMRGVRVSDPFEFTNEITPPHDNEPPKGDHDTPPSGDPDEDEVPPTDDEVPPTDEEVPPTDDEVPPTDDEDTPEDPVNTPNDEDPTEDNTVNTADETEILLWTVELLTAAGALALVVRARKRSR